MILFPMLAAIIFNLAIGGNIKNVDIAFQNKEVTDCQNIAVNHCIYEDTNNFTLSCAVLNGLRSLDYNLVKLLINTIIIILLCFNIMYGILCI